MLQILNRTWLTLAGKYTRDEKLADRLFKEIVQKYSAASRHYHNLQHINALLQLTSKYHDRLQVPEVVELAVFYHDIIYNVLRKDNETRSALLAVKRLQMLGVPAATTQQVQLFIEATQKHRINENVTNPSDLAFFLDFDMSILGAEWEAYQLYLRQIRKEYRIYPAVLYKAGRKKFVQQCLQSDHIFHTAVFREQYEPAARRNLEKELHLL